MKLINWIQSKWLDLVIKYQANKKMKAARKKSPFIY